MPTWTEIEKGLKSISDEDKSIIVTLAFLVSVRVRNGLTQQELAQRTGMKQSQIARLERLDSVPTFNTINRYANGLGYVLKMTAVPLAEANSKANAAVPE